MKLEAKSVGSWSLLQQRAAAHRTPPQELKLVWSPHSGVEGSQSFHLLLNAAYACILLKMMTQQPELMRWWVSVHSKQACIVLAADCTYLLSFEPCPSGQISTQVVAAMATAVIDICSSISALRQGRGTSPGNLAEVLGAAVIAHPWPTEAIMTVLCAFARARSMSTLGTGEEAPRMPVSRTLGHQWLLRHYILAHLTNENDGETDF
ncbi:uncharacterized protein LOC123382714 isoform X2 [Felis catus]|uniref:uncharacterized protein LOC123382714 isoform X2 n=1 Tax=Felis catus TaxID=9685 RepID=UPI001D19C313|nr:uncharacterized protein LOC123382714 isoform X2 [Felis catus]XP_044904437.1 uncharacterized protein LOC123382714 isoform X2 [Felis catus]